jgi:hypothetical protein
MSGSQSEQQGWFHRMTGKPFGQTFGIQKAPSQLEIMQKKQREDLQKAMERKKQIEDELKQKDLNVILSSREDPKIRRRDDAEVVGYLIAVAVPVSWHVLAQEGQDRTAEVSECGMAPVVCDVPVHQAP